MAAGREPEDLARVPLHADDEARADHRRRAEEAAAAFREAAAITHNESERKVLLARAEEIA